MKKKFYKAQLGILNYGIRIGNEANPFALSTDVQTPSDNIVMKLTNTNPINERIKFTDCKKLK